MNLLFLERQEGLVGWVGGQKVRGVAMNPVDHPMGGGEGKSSGGRHPIHALGESLQKVIKLGKK